MSLRHMAFVMMAASTLGFGVPPHDSLAQDRATKPSERKTVTVYTGPFGVAAYAMGQAWEDLMRKSEAPIQIFAIEGKGSVGNLRDFDRILDLREKAIHIVGDDSLTLMQKGLGVFEKNPLKHPPKRMFKIAGAWNTGNVIVTLDKSIRSIRDLAGKRVAIGSAGQGFGPPPKLFLEEGYGLKGKTDIQMIGHVAAAQALLDGKVDAAIYALHPSRDGSFIASSPGSVKLATSGREVNVLSWDRNVIQRFIDDGWPLFVVELKPGSLEGMVKEPRLAYANPVSWWAYPAFPERLAYWLTKSMLDNHKGFARYHQLGRLTTPETVCGGNPKLFHPGSLEACKEAGLIK